MVQAGHLVKAAASVRSKDARIGLHQPLRIEAVRRIVVVLDGL
jgi:hypothetical protein